MQEHGVRPDQVTQVRGFADQSPRDPATPDDPSNRRVTLIIQYQKATEKDFGAQAKEAKAGEGKPGEGKAGEAKATEAKPSPIPAKK